MSNPKGVAGKISVFGKLQAKAGHEEEARGMFGALVKPSRTAPGCITYTLYEDGKTPGIFLTYEEWESEAALQVHLDANQDTFQKANTILEGNMQMNVCKAGGVV